MIQGARLVLVGRQGAGKGTQCTRLARDLLVPHLSTGDVFRAAVRAGTPLGRRVAAILRDGGLVPTDLTTMVVAERLSQADAHHRGFLLDGFPRTLDQAAALPGLVGPRGVDAVIHLDVPAGVVRERIAGRRVCDACGANRSIADVASDACPCGGRLMVRADDAPAAVDRRLALYEAETRPVLDFFAERGLLVEVDGTGPADAVARRLLDAVGRVQRRVAVTAR